MPRSGPSYGVPGYRRGTGLKVGRAGRRQRSFWRTYVLTPIVALVVLGAAALVVAVVANLLTGPGVRQAGSPVRATGAARPGGARSGKGAGGSGRTASASGSRPGARSGSAGGGGHGSSAATVKNKGKAGAGSQSAGGALSLVRAAGGVAIYTVATGPIVATVHVAWPTWIRVVTDGRSTFVQLESTGFRARYQGQRSLDLYLGYPQGSTVTLNGTTLGPFTAKGTLWLDVTARSGG